MKQTYWPHHYFPACPCEQCQAAYQAALIREWLEEHRAEITHFRPRRWCGVEMLLPYNRSLDIPLIDGAPLIQDTTENHDLIERVLGPGFCEEPFQAQAGSRNY